MKNARINAEQALYVLDHGEGVTCLGFARARDHAQWIADQLGRPALTPLSEEHGTLAGYERYVRANAAWAASPRSSSTYFGPGVPAKLARVLEDCRLDESRVRLILGDTATGQPWMEEFDVVGRIGRSCGSCKVPLLVPAGEAGGTAILCHCLLAVIEWATGDFLYRHGAYRCPQLTLNQLGTPERPWQVMQGDVLLAAFAEVQAACGYLLFMKGISIDPKVFG
jgi:hypothetical protein